MNELQLLVKNMKIKDDSCKRAVIITKIQAEPSLTAKCVLARSYLPPQSTVIESVIKNDTNKCLNKVKVKNWKKTSF